MAFPVSPLWWPVLAVSSPILVPFLLKKKKEFNNNMVTAQELNTTRLNKAKPLALPELRSLEVTVLAEWQAEDGFLHEPGVSYLFRTDQGSLLFDLGFGPAINHNAARLGFSLNRIDALAISHLHPDHMGGLAATRNRRVDAPDSLGSAAGKACFVPDNSEAKGFNVELVEQPGMLAGGIATTGPLARSLFFPLGLTEEQAVVARLKDKGLVVFTGCGHPTIELILKMVRRLCDEPIYAIGGGLHFPITAGRGQYPGIQMQMIVGTGKAPWNRITDKDLTDTIAIMNEAAPKKVYLSAHDTCDHSLERLNKELTAETYVLSAGATYSL
jgi:7,8-dihydropterin-6-yl-methyl-4-(beta-D-ribofuranosyl)aminobenzene 5'-phosphate synthase